MEDVCMSRKKLFGLLSVFALLAAFTVCAAVIANESARFSPGSVTVSQGQAGTPNWRQGPLVLEVSFSEDRITAIEVVDHGETPSFWNRVWPNLRDAIYETQSPDGIDAVTGATASSNLIFNAVREAIRMAEGH